VSRLRAADNGLFKGFAHADRTLLDPDFNKTLLDLAANNGLMVITQSSAPCCGAGITSPGGDGHDGWSRSGRSPRRRIQCYGHGSAAHLPERGTSHTDGLAGIGSRWLDRATRGRRLGHKRSISARRNWRSCQCFAQPPDI
jgi:hypothetical protein